METIVIALYVMCGIGMMLGIWTGSDKADFWTFIAALFMGLFWPIFLVADYAQTHLTGAVEK